jgi:hypothetical protein
LNHLSHVHPSLSRLFSIFSPVRGPYQEKTSFLSPYRLVDQTESSRHNGALSNDHASNPFAVFKGKIVNPENPNSRLPAQIETVQHGNGAICASA